MEAAIRGLNFLFGLSRKAENFAKFGSDIVQTFYDVGTVAPEPLRKEALVRVEHLAERWRSTYRSLRDIQEGDSPDAQEITLVIMSLYTLERVGLSHELKRETEYFVGKKRHSVADYMGFDVSRPRVLITRSDRYSILTNAMHNAFVASKVGIDLGTTLSEVMEHLRYLRPYRQPPTVRNGPEHDLWVDQITMVFNVVHICSNFGELRLKKELLPDEFTFLRLPNNMETAIRTKDVHIVGELCHCFRIFGVAEKDAELSRGLRFILETQNTKDGSWPVRESVDADVRGDPYSRFHACMCAIMALYQPIFRGYGPGSVSLREQLLSWQDAKTGPAALLAQSTQGVVKIIEDAYTVRSDTNSSFEHRTDTRLQSLLVWYKVCPRGSLPCLPRDRISRRMLVPGIEFTDSRRL